MEKFIIDAILVIGTVTVSVWMLWLTAFSTYWTLVYVGRLVALFDTFLNVVRWRTKIPASEWKKIRYIALPYISEK